MTTTAPAPAATPTAVVTIEHRTEMTLYRIVVGSMGPGLAFVALPDFGTSAQMGYRGVTADYVAEKLRLASPASSTDAHNVAVALNVIDVDGLLRAAYSAENIGQPRPATSAGVVDQLRARSSATLPAKGE